jgi:hypothetical protein
MRPLLNIASVPCAAKCCTRDSNIDQLTALHPTDRSFQKVTITPPPENNRVLAQSLEPLHWMMAWISHARYGAGCLLQGLRPPPFS